MEAIKKILRTPSAFVLFLAAIVSLIGVIIKSENDKAIARMPIDATSAAEARLTEIANFAGMTQSAISLSLTSRPLPAGTETPPPSSPNVPPYVFPTETPTSSQIAGIQLIGTTFGKNPDYLRIQVVLQNHLDKQVFMNHVIFFWDQGDKVCLCLEEPCYYSYTISDQIFITTVPSNREGTVEFTVPVYPKDQAFDGYAQEVNGSTGQGCGQNYIEMEFDISVVLEPTKLTALYVDIPVSLFETIYRRTPTTVPEIQVTTNIGSIGEIERFP